jgi:hypothetical protein
MGVPKIRTEHEHTVNAGFTGVLVRGLSLALAVFIQGKSGGTHSATVAMDDARRFEVYINGGGKDASGGSEGDDRSCPGSYGHG